MSKSSESMEKFITRIIQLSDAQFVEFFKTIPAGGMKMYANHILRSEAPEFNDAGSSYEFIIQPLEKKS
jgi:hypothetical protein